MILPLNKCCANCVHWGLYNADIGRIQGKYEDRERGFCKAEFDLSEVVLPEWLKNAICTTISMTGREFGTNCEAFESNAEALLTTEFKDKISKGWIPFVDCAGPKKAWYIEDGIYKSQIFKSDVPVMVYRDAEHAAGNFVFYAAFENYQYGFDSA